MLRLLYSAIFGQLPVWICTGESLTVREVLDLPRAPIQARSTTTDSHIAARLGAWTGLPGCHFDEAPSGKGSRSMKWSNSRALCPITT